MPKGNGQHVGRNERLDFALSGWPALNTVMKTLESEGECTELIERELANLRRERFVFRIHSRLNRIRAARERKELKERLK